MRPEPNVWWQVEAEARRIKSGVLYLTAKVHHGVVDVVDVERVVLRTTRQEAAREQGIIT